MVHVKDAPREKEKDREGERGERERGRAREGVGESGEEERGTERAREPMASCYLDIEPMQ